MAKHRKYHWKTLSGWASLEGRWLRQRHFAPEALARIAPRIQQSERDHEGELVLAVEAVMPPHEDDLRERALEVFGRLRVWDTPQRTGVLLYLALDRHGIEIVADRGVAVPEERWQAVCEALQAQLQAGDYLPGVLAAIEAIEHLLRGCCGEPAGRPGRVNALPDAPVLL